MVSDEIACLRDIWVNYDGATALEEVNLSIFQRDFLGIIGPNGGGKTTLLKVLLGLVRPSKGQVTVFGDLPWKSRKLMGYVPQNTQIDPSFPIDVWNVVLMGRCGKRGLYRQYRADDKRIAAEALQTVEMLHLKNRQMGRLSEGQQQRVLVARALVSEPKLLLLDEPTASIDPTMQTGFYELLEKLKEQMAIVLVSHDMSAVSVHVDKIACLNRRLFYHNSKELSPEDLEATYQCPVELIAHGVPHRVLKEHKGQ